jgi:ion channel-forming bestrophin family protein
VRLLLSIYALGTKTTLILPHAAGVVIGFVISYRASSAYDLYTVGRTAWSDVVKNTRTLMRLIWFHVPLRLTPKGFPDRLASGEEIDTVMKEKRVALDLLEG